MTPADLGRLQQALEQCVTGLAKAQQIAADPALRRQFQTLAAEIQQNQAKFLTEYRGALDSVQQRMAKVQEASQETIQKMETLRAGIKEPEAPSARKMPEAPAPEPVLQLDPDLGPRLRRELLEHFSRRRQTATLVDDELDREIWMDWDEPEKPPKQ